MAFDKKQRVKDLRARDGDNCQECGLRMNFNLPRESHRAPSIDHIIPRAAGGTNRIENTRLVHYYPCNARKGAVYEGVDYQLVPSDTPQGKEWDEWSSARDSFRNTVIYTTESKGEGGSR